MNFLTPQICLYRFSTHVSNLQLFLLYSRRADFELHFGLLADGVERLAGILEHVLDSAFDVFEELNLLQRASFFSGFSTRRLRPYSSRPIHWLNEKSRVALHDVRGHPFLPGFPLWTFPCSVQLQHELHHELLAHTLVLLFRSLLKVQSVSALLSPGNKHVVLPIYSHD